MEEVRTIKNSKYMDIKNLTSNSADIYFYGDIVGSEWEKWTDTDTDTAPSDVLAQLDQVKDADQLNIYISSGGGSVFAGLSVYNMLKRHPANKTVHVDGLAGSISSVIAMAGDQIYIPSNAFLMIHKPWNVVMGNSNDFRKMADDLDRIEQGIMNVYADKLADGVDIDTIRQLVDAETWLDGNAASQYFNVTTVEPNKMAACISDSFASYRNVPEVFREQKQIEVHNAVDEDEITKLRIQLELL